MKKKFLILVALVLVFASKSWAFDSFVIKDIQVVGLQRISLGAVLNDLTLKVGDTFNEKRSIEVIRSLFKSGFYHDISLERDNDVLIVTVKERPAIASIAVTGNKDIDTDTMMAELKKLGLAENQIFNRSLLDNVEQGLRQQYFSLGKYGMKITSKVVPKDQNRVDVSLQIREGKAAEIRRINIVGNTVYDEEDLVGRFELAEEATFFSDADKYSQPKLRADLETLRSYYLDRGFINFKILSTQVTISPNKKDIFITINISEGEKYYVGEIIVAGEMVVSKEELMAQITIFSGDVFSRKQVSVSSNFLGERLGFDGYAFANVNAVPDINEEEKKVSLTFFIDPGKRVYVRRINITGNDKTNDEVIRREFRQLEAAWYEPKKLNRTRTRLQRLSFFEDINIETPQVPGTDDQVDVNLRVVEGSTGSISGGIGYGEPRGILFNAKVSLNNFVGTGKRVSFEASNDDINTVYSFSFFNPYHTVSGVSRNLSLFFRKTDAGESNIADFNLDERGARVNYGFPLSEFSTARLGFAAQKTNLDLTNSFIRFYQEWSLNNGEEFNSFPITLGWSYDTRDRTFLSTTGHLTRISSEVSLLGGLEYYNILLNQDSSWRIGKGFTFRAKGEIAFGDSYGTTTDYPFFRRFYTGGSRSVRGYSGNTLGPRDNDLFVDGADEVIGGTLKTVGSLELAFPLPFMAENKSVKTGLFIDAGNVFMKSGTLSVDGEDLGFDTSEIRGAYGLFALWVTPVGVLTFSWGFPVNDQVGDDTEFFQFTIGAPF